MRWMSIDHGTRRIGVALCDPGETIATPTRVVSNEPGKAVDGLIDLAIAESVEAVVIGLPKHEDGAESGTAFLVRKFAAELEAGLAARVPPGIPVKLWDEGHTSVEAERLLSERGVPRRDRAGRRDAVAAALILEDLVASRRSRGIPVTSPDV